MKKLTPVLFVLLILASCGQPKSVSLSSKSPNGNTVISVNGKKASGLDPFTVTMDVKTNGNEETSLQFEITAADLNDSNVKFKWADDNNCRITFVQTDGGERVFAYYATAGNVMVKELKNE